VPKQTLKIQDFSGGLNSLQDPRDIPANAFSELDSVKIDDPGRIRLSGGIVEIGNGTGYAADHDQDTAAFQSEVQFLGFVKPGTGLFQFASDKKVVKDANTLYNYKKIQTTESPGTEGDYAPATEDTHVTLLHKGHDNSSTAMSKVSIYDHTTDEWALDHVDLGATPTATSLSEPLYYNCDGAIRMQESNLNLGSDQMILQYIDRNHFIGATGDATAGNVFKGWFYNKQGISYNPHYEDGSGNTTGTGTIQATTFNSDNTTPDDTSLSNECQKVHVLHMFDDDTEAIGWNATGLVWNGAISFVYDDGQESPLKVDTSTWAVAEEKKVKFKLRVCASESATVHLNPRLKGIKYYIKQSTSSDIKSTSWMLAGVFEFDGAKGARRPQDTTFNGWTYQTGGGTVKTFYAETDYFSAPPVVRTFRTETGRAFDEATEAHYKCAVVANRRVYIGNVTHSGNVEETQKRYPDRMLKSGLANGIMMHDVFPGNAQLDLAINDGDEIVELAHFMGKILQFKKRAVYVINVAGAQEYLESTHKYLGVEHKSQVCTLASGIAWACKKGVMLYNGESITNLIDGRLSVDDWQSFYSAANNITLGYDSNDAKVIISEGAAFASNKSAYIFDMKLKCFIFKKYATATEERFSNSYTSNMLTDFNGDIIWYTAIDANDNHLTEEGSRMHGWSRTSQSSRSFAVVTKDIDFGEPSIGKKFYKAYVTFKNGDSNSGVTCEYFTDGRTGWSAARPFKTDTDNIDPLGGQHAGDGPAVLAPAVPNTWQVAELKPLTPADASNIKSLKLQFQGSGKMLTGTVTVAGSGYSAGDIVFNLYTRITLAVGGSGELTGITIVAGGKNWMPGDIIEVAGGDHAGRIRVDTVEGVDDDFEINDITVIFRPKRAK